MGIHASIPSLHYHPAGPSINPPFCWKHHAVFQYQTVYVLCWWHSSPEGKVLHQCPWIKQWNCSYIASIFSHRDSVNLKKWICLYTGSVARVYALALWSYLWSRLEGRWRRGARSMMANKLRNNSKYWDTFFSSERRSGGLKRREVLLVKSIVALSVFSVANQLTSHFKSSDLCFIEFPCVEQSRVPVGICFPNGLSNYSTLRALWL